MSEFVFLKKRILNWIDVASRKMTTVQESLNMLQRCKYYLEGTSGRYVRIFSRVLICSVDTFYVQPLFSRYF